MARRGGTAAWSASLAVALSFGLLALHAGAELLGLPGLAALDVADRVGSIGGIAALTVITEQGLRRRRWAVVPLALLGQVGLLALPSVLHADAVGAVYDPRALLVGAALQLLLTAAVVAVALHVEHVVERLLAARAAVVVVATVHPVTGPPALLLSRATGRPPGRGPPVLRTA